MKEKKPGVFKEFLAFINKGNAVALAVGVIIGGAFTGIVTAINKNIISPLIAWAIGDTNLSESVITVLTYKEAAEADVTSGIATKVGEEIPDIVISWGSLIQAVIDFLLIAIILFVIVKIVTSVVNSAKRAKEKLENALKQEEQVVEEAPAPAEPVVVEDPADIKLLSEIRDLLKQNSELLKETTKKSE